MIVVNIGDFEINQIILLSPQLQTDAILGLDFLVDYNSVFNIADVRVFVGLASFYRKLVDNFAAEAKPLSELTKVIPFICGPEQ